MEMTFSLDIQPFHFDFSGTKPNNYNFKVKLSSSFSLFAQTTHTLPT